jgi:hypothetical protein
LCESSPLADDGSMGRASRAPSFVQPMTATNVSHLLEGHDWLYEVKLERTWTWKREAFWSWITRRKFITRTEYPKWAKPWASASVSRFA